MVNYDYLEWGAALSPEDKIKTTDYKELESMEFFNTDKDTVVYDEAVAENNEYNVWYLESIPENPWGVGTDERAERRASLEAQIENFVKEVVPGHQDWAWGEGTFLDAFLLEDVCNVDKTQYESVLLLAPDRKSGCPLAVVWEMIPQSKRSVLLNLQRSGHKIFAAFSDHFKFPSEDFVCLEVYIKK
ncbi:MAG: hypothetical protein RR626_09170 [Anaerovoracaceae bacterium]